MGAVSKDVVKLLSVVLHSQNKEQRFLFPMAKLFIKNREKKKKKRAYFVDAKV